MIKSRSRSAQQSGSLQARIHTGFHRFTEIGQIFHNKYIFNNNEILSKLKLRDEIIRRFARLHPRRMELTKYWLNDVEIQKISRYVEHSPDPPISLRLRRSLRKSVSISPTVPTCALYCRRPDSDILLWRLLSKSGENTREFLVSQLTTGVSFGGEVTHQKFQNFISW